ncbi:MAG: MerR family transcriptional regulator [Bacteroidales bacterium]|nr:MerR family transcriptional regulator [Bacteroidales bacterium]
MEKKKYYYTIGETADILGETVSRIRFWTDSFADAVKPHRNKKGNRIYTEADIETLKAIKYLTKDCGMTIKGAQERLRTQKTMGQAPTAETLQTSATDGTQDLKAKAEVLNRLKEIRETLVSLCNYL